MDFEPKQKNKIHAIIHKLINLAELYLPCSIQ